MAKRNIKTVKIIIENEQKLKMIQMTFALKTLFYEPNKLQVGENIINMGHANFGHIKRLGDIVPFKMIDITAEQ